MRKTLLSLALLLPFLAAVHLVAAEGPRFVHRSHGSMVEHVAKALDLTAEQKAAVEKIHAGMEAKMTSLRQDHHTQMKAVHELLDSASPDPTEVGEKMIAAHAVHKQIQALHEDAMTRVNALLTEEQKAKHEEMRAKHKGMRMHRMGPGHNGDH